MVESDRSFLPHAAGRRRSDSAAEQADPAAPGSGVARWVEGLQGLISAEILPALLSAPLQPVDGGPGSNMPEAVSEADVRSFARLILDDRMEEARAVADRVLLPPGGRETLLLKLLTPAARDIGQLWEQDRCDFMDVTLGTHRLDRLMKETEYAGARTATIREQEHRVLLLPAPGEQHGFGIGMVADVFRAGGWCVRSGAAVPRQKLVRLVRDEWFDVVGLSVGAERWLASLATCVRAVRQASRNQNLIIMLGGHAIVGHEERSRFLGADMVAADAYQALQLADRLVANLPERKAVQSARQLRLT